MLHPNIRQLIEDYFVKTKFNVRRADKELRSIGIIIDKKTLGTIRKSILSLKTTYRIGKRNHFSLAEEASLSSSLRSIMASDANIARKLALPQEDRDMFASASENH